MAPGEEEKKEKKKRKEREVEKEDMTPAKKATQEKKEHAPKLRMSAYMFYCKEQRPLLMGMNSDLDVKEVGKRLWDSWGQLNDVEKEPYKQLLRTIRE